MMRMRWSMRCHDLRPATNLLVLHAQKTNSADDWLNTMDEL